MKASTSPSAADILPPELLLSTLALTRPTRRLPATCALIATGFRSTDPTLQRSWHHHIVFHGIPIHGWSTGLDAAINDESAYGGQQISSWLSLFLKMRLRAGGSVVCICDGIQRQDCQYGRPAGPCYAIFGSPDTPLNDLYINRDLIDFLFAPKTGPFARHPKPTLPQIRDKLASFWVVPFRWGSDDQADDDADDEDLDAGAAEFKLTTRHLDHRKWQLLPDALQLLCYFLRAGDHVLFRHTLSLLHQHQPNLAKTTAPVFHWSAHALDNRAEFRQAFQALGVEDPTACVSFPVFLATLSAIDWSLPCIEAVVDVFNVAPSEITDWIRSKPEMMECFLTMCYDVPNAPRVGRVLDWVELHGVEFDDVFPMTDNACSWPVFVLLFNRYDRPQVQAGGLPVELKHHLGELIAQFTCKVRQPGGLGGGAQDAQQHLDELTQVVRFGLEHGLMSAETRGDMYGQALVALESGYVYEQEWIDLVKEFASEQEWVDILHGAITSALPPMLGPHNQPRTHARHNPNSNPSVIARLLAQLHADHKLSPTDYFTLHGQAWDWRRAAPLFSAHPLPVQFDLVACAAQVADWSCLPPRPGLWPVAADLRMQQLSHLLDMAVARDPAGTERALKDLSQKQVTIMATACAWYLGMRAQVGPMPARAHDMTPDEDVPSAATRAAVMRAWKHTESMSTTDWRPCFAFLPNAMLACMLNLVREAASEACQVACESMDAAPSARAQRIARGDTRLARGLAYLLEFDDHYVACNASWDRDTPAWLWSTCVPGLVAGKVGKPAKVLEVLRRVAWAGSVEDVLAVIRRVPEKWWVESIEWLSMLKEFVESRPPGSELWDRLAEKRPGWWQAVDEVELVGSDSSWETCSSGGDDDCE